MSSAAAAGLIFLAIFLSGVVIGMLATVAVAVRSEDRRYSLSGAAPGVLARGARLLTGFGGSGLHYLPRGWARS
jgi:hypothetical protein